MIVTKKWLEDHEANKRMIDWFINQQDTDSFKVIDKLIEEKRLCWACDLIMRLMNQKQSYKWLVLIKKEATGLEDITRNTISKEIYTKNPRPSRDDFYYFIEMEIEFAIECIYFNERGKDIMDEEGFFYGREIKQHLIEQGIKILKDEEWGLIKYCTDKITNIICQYYHGEIEEKNVSSILQEIASKEELADYILDSFNRQILSPSVIEKIIKEEV